MAEGRMREKETIRARIPRKKEYCGHCGGRIQKYKKIRRDEKGNILALGICSNCGKER